MCAAAKVRHCSQHDWVALDLLWLELHGGALSNLCAAPWGMLANSSRGKRLVGECIVCCYGLLHVGYM